MVRIVLALLILLILLFPQASEAEEVWHSLNSGINDTDIRSISVFAKDDDIICASGVGSVYFSREKGRSWKEIFSLKSGSGEINFVCFDFCDPKVIYLATTKGLYVTKDQGEFWQRIFRRPNESANNIHWITQDSSNPQKIYIGTDEGLYVSCDLGVDWNKSGGGLPHSGVSSIAVHPSNSYVLYVANTFGLFKSQDMGLSWKRVYVTSARSTDDENGNGNEEDREESFETEENQTLINCITIDRDSPKKVFIATSEGVYGSADAGESWSKLPTEGLLNNYVNFIVAAKNEKDTLYAATEKGVFEYLPKSKRWRQIHQGMTALGVRSLALDMDKGQLFAGTEMGVFQTTDLRDAKKQNEELDSNEDTYRDVEQTLKNLTLCEPTIHEVQEAALKYAEVVHPERIKSLRKSARLKALFPDFSIGYDKTINYDSSADRYYVGPYDWGFTFSWDIGDLVFNEQVRLIDSNARLMVQLRYDILDEVTRLYYERRRLQTELILDSPQTPEQKLDKQLRLEELTASIDGLTGGYFSPQLTELNFKR